MSWIKDNIDKDISNILCEIELIVIKDGKKVKLKTRDFRPDLDVDYDNLEAQLEEIPSQHAFWSLLLAEQESELSILERKNKFKRAQITEQILDEAKKNNVKLPRWEMDELLEAHSDVGIVEMKLILAKRNKLKLKAVVDSLKMKSESLRSLAGFKRQEKSNP